MSARPTTPASTPRSAQQVPPEPQAWGATDAAAEQAPTAQTDIPEEELPALLEHCIRRYYQKDYAPMLNRLAKDCVWIGAGNMLFFGRDALLPALEVELEGPTYTMREQSFWLLATGDPNSALVMGIFDLYSGASEHMLCATHQRVTAFCRLIEGRWLCQHLHSSNEWGELVGDEIFPYEVSTQTYQYVQRIVKTAQRLAPQHPRIVLRLDGSEQIVDTGAIAYVEARRKECVVRLGDDELSVKMSISELERDLPAGFVRVHRSYVVNADHVRSIERYQVTLDNGRAIPVSIKRYDTVREQIVAHCRLTGPSEAPGVTTQE